MNFFSATASTILLLCLVGVVVTSATTSATSGTGGKNNENNSPVFKIFEVPLPDGGTIDVTQGVYASESSDTLFVPILPADNQFFYDPNHHRYVSNAVLPFIIGDNHVDETYYDAETNVVVAQMEFHKRGGIGAYFPQAFNATTMDTLWVNTSLLVHRNVVGGLAGVLSGTVVFLHISSGATSPDVVALDIHSGAQLYRIPAQLQARCITRTGNCVAVAANASGSSFTIFRARDGKTLFTGTTTHSTFTPGNIFDDFFQVQTGDGYDGLNLVTGELHRITNDGNPQDWHKRGPNIIRGEEENATDIVARAISSGDLIVNFTKSPSGRYNLHANYQVIVVEEYLSANRMLHFYAASTGAFMGCMNATNLSGPAPYGTPGFLVGTAFVLPMSTSGYDVYDGATGKSYFASRGISLFAPNIMYLPDSTVMYGVGTYLVQFVPEKH